LCRDLHGIEITVVSDGFDRVIASVLARAGLDLPFFANRLEWEGADRWRLAFPNSRSDCRTLSGNCKCQFAAARRERVGIMIGDGRSDFCISERVDVVLAKGALAGHCREMGLPHYPIEGFAEANRLLLTWLEAGLQRRGDGEVHFESAAK
jgi:2-hydroxy-3-keto-5-methylthiopentenyl-1-phosphate phosphatase